jgi:hypothetical protein
VGRGAVGEEPVPLVVVTLCSFEVAEPALV